MKWHEEALDAAGIEAAERLAAACPEFYLAGGTALALRMGHRVSLDLDLFSGENRLEGPQRSGLLDELRSGGPLRVQASQDRTCHLFLGATSVSLFHYAYPLQGKLGRWRGLRIASVEDIGAMKISAVIGRGSRKDFIDLFWICRKTGLEAVLRTCAVKFPDTHEFFLQAARALVYFEDAEKEPMPRLLAPVEWTALKGYFEKEARAAFRRRM